MTEHTNQQNQVEYLHLAELVDHYNLDVTPAELHGVMTGGVCTAGQNPDADEWIKLVTPYAGNEQPISAQVVDILKILYQLTRHELNSATFEFNPALPDMDTSSEFRTQELASWCHGFMMAYRHSITNEDNLDDDAREMLDDLGQIAMAEAGDGEEEDHETALAELEEYIRVGVQLIYDELNPAQTLH